MMDKLKELLERSIEKWIAQIDASPDKQTVIDISTVF